MRLETNKKNWEEESRKKLLDPEKLHEEIFDLRKKGLSIVSLNGTFDLLHAGHLHMIYEASLQGDILVVALNTDRSIKQLKGSSKPIVSLKHRLQMIAAIQFVDFVTFFDELDPREVLKKIQPDVHVNGSEYGMQCIESELVKQLGGKLHIVDLIPMLSTSSIIKKIQQCV